MPIWSYYYDSCGSYRASGSIRSYGTIGAIRSYRCDGPNGAGRRYRPNGTNGAIRGDRCDRSARPIGTIWSYYGFYRPNGADR